MASQQDPDTQLRNEARASLERLQRFDVQSLVRESELGLAFHFRDVVEPAERLIGLYKRLAMSALDDLPQPKLQQVRDQANQDYNRLSEVQKFDPAQPNAKTQQQTLIQTTRERYQAVFEVLHPLIAYSLHKTADFQRLEGEARATLQKIKDEASAVTASLQRSREEASAVLEEVRKVATEQGVTQQAIYFRDSAAEHDKQASQWQSRTVWTSVGLGLYALASMLLHKIPWIAPENAFQTIQLAVSKVLVFGVMSYMLYLCARIMVSHRHCSVIDRHRQNALLTYKALTEAAGDTAHREVILVQAAACIFAPQGTGYSGDALPQPPGVQSVVEFLSRNTKAMAG